MKQAQQMLQKLFSRKFIVTLAAVATAVTGTNLEGGQLFVVAVAAAAYVLAEAFTDRARGDQLAQGVEQGIAIGREANPQQLDADELVRVRAALAVARPSSSPPKSDTIPVPR